MQLMRKGDITSQIINCIDIILSAMATVLAKWAAQQNNINTIYYLAGDVAFTHELHDLFWPAMNQANPSVKDGGYF